MKKEYMCYCGLYCENCSVKTKVGPAAAALYGEMKKAGFEGMIGTIPGGGEFWDFLKGMSGGVCTSCKEGSGHPGCGIRACARERGEEMCALCAEYPCGRFDEFSAIHPMIGNDNLILREKGIEEWAKMQDDRKAKGYTYADDKAGRI
jgi:hypothetical protein